MSRKRKVSDKAEVGTEDAPAPGATIDAREGGLVLDGPHDHEALLAIGATAIEDRDGDTVAWPDGLDLEPYAEALKAIQARRAARKATGYALVQALTSDQAAKADAGAKKDLLRLLARGGDLIPETNSFVARLAKAAGIKVPEWFDLALAGG